MRMSWFKLVSIIGVLATVGALAVAIMSLAFAATTTITFESAGDGQPLPYSEAGVTFTDVSGTGSLLGDCLGDGARQPVSVSGSGQTSLIGCGMEGAGPDGTDGGIQADTPPTPYIATSKGKVNAMFPVGNTGADPGQGFITPRNSSGGFDGQPYLTFHTPTDVVAGQVLFVGQHVTYTEGPGNTATAVVQDGDGTGDV
jgi:hypothetical protein